MVLNRTSRRGFLRILSAGALITLSACQGFNPPTFGPTGGGTDPISIEVRRALRNDPETSLINIHVTTSAEGTVKLSGRVNTDAEVYAAERVAYNVEGVKFVANALTLIR